MVITWFCNYDADNKYIDIFGILCALKLEK